MSDKANLFLDFEFKNNSGYRTNQTIQHYHDSYEIYYMSKGHCKYFINNKTYEVNEGDLVIVPSGVLHRTLYGDDFHQRSLINCNKRFVPSFAVAHLLSCPVYKNAQALEEIKQVFNKIKVEYQAIDSASEEILSAYMTELFALVVRNKNQKDFSYKGSPLVEEIIDYIINNITEDLKLSTIADKYFVSPEHLSRVFKKETGFNYNEFVVTIRLRHAEKLLTSSKKPSVTQVAYACGFLFSARACA